MAGAEFREPTFPPRSERPHHRSAMATSTLLPGSVLHGDGQAEWRSRRKRTWFQQGGSVPSALCLAKAAVGAGVLTMVTQCAKVGLAVTTVILVLGVILTVVSIRMIGEASIATRCGSFEDICDELLYPYVSFFTGFLNAMNGLGSAISYLWLCGEASVTLFSDSDGQPTFQKEHAIVFFGLAVGIPLSICRKITVLRYCALVSLCGTGFLVVAMLIVLQKYKPAEGHGPDVTAHEVWFHQSSDNTAVTHMNIVNTILFAYNSQSNVPQLTGELESEAWNSVNGMAWLSTLLCFAIYFTVATVGVVTFGFLLPTQPQDHDHFDDDNLIALLAPYQNEIFVKISFVAIMVSLMCCLEFHIFPVRQFFGYCFRRLRGRGRDEELTDQKCCHASCTRWLDIFGAFVTIAIATILATIFPITKMGPLLSLLGGFAVTYTGFVIPPLWLLALRRKDDDYSLRNSDVLLAIAMLVVGLISFVLGTAAALIGTGTNSTLSQPVF